MAITRRALGLSLILSACVVAVLLVVFSQVGEEAVSYAASENSPAPRRRTEPAGEGKNSPHENPRLRAIIKNLVTPWGHVNQRAVRALKASGPGIVPILLARFTGADNPEQEALLEVLAGFSDPAITQALMEHLESVGSMRMALKIGRILEPSEDPDLCGRLITLAHSHSPEARAAAALAMGNCSGPRAALTLLTLLKRDENEIVRSRALESLKRAPAGTVKQAILAAARDPSPRIRARAVRIASDRGLNKLEDLLAELFRQDPSIRVKRAAHRALGVLRAGEKVQREFTVPPPSRAFEEESFEEEPEDFR